MDKRESKKRGEDVTLFYYSTISFGSTYSFFFFFLENGGRVGRYTMVQVKSLFDGEISNCSTVDSLPVLPSCRRAQQDWFFVSIYVLS